MDPCSLPHTHKDVAPALSLHKISASEPSPAVLLYNAPAISITDTHAFQTTNLSSIASDASLAESVRGDLSRVSLDFLAPAPPPGGPPPVGDKAASNKCSVASLPWPASRKVSEDHAASDEVPACQQVRDSVDFPEDQPISNNLENKFSDLFRLRCVHVH